LNKTGKEEKREEIYRKKHTSYSNVFSAELQEYKNIDKKYYCIHCSMSIKDLLASGPEEEARTVCEKGEKFHQ
jgi:hypothetical protein